MSLTNNVEAKLDILVRLIAIWLCGEKSQTEKIGILASAGLQPKEIADIIGTTSNTVSVALSTLKKQRKTPHSRKRQKANQ